jgi:hypothetical protein
MLILKDIVGKRFVTIPLNGFFQSAFMQALPSPLYRNTVDNSAS